MNTLGQFLGLDPAALRTFLTRPTRINRDGPFTSVRSFVSEKEQEQAPASIRDGLGELTAGKALDVQVLTTDQVETINELPALAVSKVLALRCNPLVEARHAADGLASIVASLAFAAQSLFRNALLA